MQKFQTIARPLFLSLALILSLAALSSRACDGGYDYGYNHYRPSYGHDNYNCENGYCYPRRVVVIVEEPKKEVVVAPIVKETVVAPVVKETVVAPVVKTDVVQQPVVTETPKVVTETPKVDAPIETANKDVQAPK
ncbi:MAG TPA: hypothetical protein VKX17_18345 [Planctomycetota bacterium]|nr:hypothetical protein [Planctomycetota bacterium]